MGLIFPHPLIYTYSFGFSTYHLDAVIFALYANYAALNISCFTPILAVCHILRHSYDCFVSCAFLQHLIGFLSRGIFTFIFPVLYVSAFLSFFCSLGIYFFFTCELKSSLFECWINVFEWRGPFTLHLNSKKAKKSCVTAYHDTPSTIIFALYEGLKSQR